MQVGNYAKVIDALTKEVEFLRGQLQIRETKTAAFELPSQLDVNAKGKIETLSQYQQYQASEKK